MEDKTIDLIIDKIDQHSEHTQFRLDKIDANLAEHMRRTDVLEDLHRDNATRIEKLEEPRKLVIMLQKIVLGVGGLFGTIYGIYRVWEIFK